MNASGSPPAVLARYLQGCIPRGTGALSQMATGRTPDCLPALQRSWSHIRGVVFDMGDVLYDAGAWRRWLARLLARQGVTLPTHVLFRIWDQQYLDDVHRGRRDYAEAFAAFLEGLGLSAGQREEVLAASWARKRELEAQVIPIAGVRAALAALAERGVRLAALSDSEHPAEQLYRLLVKLGLNTYFTSVISSRDLGQTKPAPTCYLAALASLKLRPEEAAFVGHDAEELAGAARVGMATIAFNYERTAVADVYLFRMDALPALLTGRTARAA